MVRRQRGFGLLGAGHILDLAVRRLLQPPFEFLHAGFEGVCTGLCAISQFSFDRQIRFEHILLRFEGADAAIDVFRVWFRVSTLSGGYMSPIILNSVEWLEWFAAMVAFEISNVWGYF